MADAPHRSRWRHTAWRIVRAPLVAYIAIVLIMMFFENSMLLHPIKYPKGYWDLPSNVEDAWFTADDGTKLHGWYGAIDEPRAVVLFSHGNAGNVSHRGERIENLNRHGIAVMVYDYRGFGRSEGAADARHLLADARAARTWLAQRASLPERDIVLWGESLGGGVAVDLAAKDGARGLVLENTFSSLTDVAAHHYPWLPIRTLMRTRLESAEQIHDYHGPLLWCHGTSDTIVPYTVGRKLFDAANEPKFGVAFEGGGHNGPPYPENRRDFQQPLERFLTALPPLQRPRHTSASVEP